MNERKKRMQLYIESECKESILFVALHPIKKQECYTYATIRCNIQGLMS